jgi:hypothetical protein
MTVNRFDPMGAQPNSQPAAVFQKKVFCTKRQEERGSKEPEEERERQRSNVTKTWAQSDERAACTAGGQTVGEKEPVSTTNDQRPNQILLAWAGRKSSRATRDVYRVTHATQHTTRFQGHR